MGLRIATNMGSLVTQRAISQNSEGQVKSYQRLSSGNRITGSGDDAAGLAISENLRAQIRSMGQAERNANDGISFVQVAEGGLNEIGNIMIRLRELAIQAASDTIGDKERGFINKEVQSLVQEVDRIANVTNFNGTQLLNGAGPSSLSFQVGIRKEANGSDQISFKPSEFDVQAGALGVSGLDYANKDDARNGIDKVDTALSKVFEARANLGAFQNKLQSTVNNIGITKENLSAARSRIADADVASETANLVKSNILQAAGISVLSQANMAPQQALKLLS
jgi:flagellin